MIGRSTCVVTRSDLMRVSHSWTPKLNIHKILKHFWPASEHCRQATNKYMDFIFHVRALTSVTYPPCIYEGMGMHSWFTVVCQIWGQFRWNLVIYGSKCPNQKGVNQTAKSPNGTIDTGLNHSGSIPICLGWSTSAVTRSEPYAGQSQLDAKIEYS